MNSSLQSLVPSKYSIIAFKHFSGLTPIPGFKIAAALQVGHSRGRRAARAQPAFFKQEYDGAFAPVAAGAEEEGHAEDEDVGLVRDRFLGLHEDSLLGLHITLQFEEYRGERGFAQQRDGIAQRAHDSLLLRRDSGVRRGQKRPTRTPLRAAAQPAASWAEASWVAASWVEASWAAVSWAAPQGRTA